MNLRLAHLSVALLLLAPSGEAIPVSMPSAHLQGPQLMLARKGDARVFIFGFGEAKDTSWLTPKIRNAFEQSTELWLETAPRNASESETPAERQASAERIYRLSHETGRTLFDALKPAVRQRTLAYVAELEINVDSIRGLRPWKAYYSLVSAFWSKRKVTDHAVYVDAVLREAAGKAGMRVGYEFPNSVESVNFFASMSEEAQNEYMEWLLDFLDDYKLGRNDDAETYSWISGDPGSAPTRSLTRMRTKQPVLYQVMQPARNRWWARKIDGLLSRKGTYFVGVGQLHVLGPDGIPTQLARRGIRVELVP
jgi:uncharacterized protein